MPNESKEKKLSQDEVRLAGGAKRFLKQASIATKNFRIFGATHPVLKNNLHNCYELLKGLLVAKDSVTLTFMEGVCLVEEIPLKDIDLKVYSFLTDVNECGITSLTFLNALSEDELAALLNIISDGPAALRAENGLIDYLQRKNISSIKTDEIFFKKVTKKEEEASEARKHLEDFLLINYLLGKSAVSKDDIESIAGEISVNPARLGKIISDIALSNGSGQGGKGAGGAQPIPAGASAVEFARSSIEKVAGQIKSAPGKSDSDIKKDVGRLILALEPSLRNEVLKSEIKSSGKSDDIVKSAIAELSDEIIIELVVSDYVEKRSSVVEVKKIIGHLIKDFSKRKKIFPVIEKRLLQKGVTQAVCSKILYEEFWSDMSVDEKVKRITSEAPSYSVEIGIADEIGKLVEDLLVEKKYGAVGSIIDKILANFQAGETGFKMRAAREFGKILTLLLESKDYPYKDKLLNDAIGAYGNIKEKEVKTVYSKEFAPLIKLCAKKRLYSYLPLLTKSIGYQNIKDEVFTEISLESLLRDMLFSEKLGTAVLTDFSKVIGEDAKRALSNMLMSILPDDFDSYRKRYDIANVLKEMGRDAEDFLMNNLSSEKADVVKNSLEALSEIGTQKAIPAIEALYNHKNPNIRNHAKIAVKMIKERG